MTLLSTESFPWRRLFLMKTLKKQSWPCNTIEFTCNNLLPKKQVNKCIYWNFENNLTLVTKNSYSFSYNLWNLSSVHVWNCIQLLHIYHIFLRMVLKLHFVSSSCYGLFQTFLLLLQILFLFIGSSVNRFKTIKKI